MKSTALERLRKPNTKSLEKLTELLRAYLFLRPVIWFLRFYDDYWADRFRRKPDILELARIAKGEIPLHAPAPLPRKRKRALTNPLPAIDVHRDIKYSIRRARQRTDEQRECLFLQRLPIELRTQVYEEVLAGGGTRRLVHILRKRGRLGHWRCRIQEGGEVCGDQHKGEEVDGADGNNRYSEAVEVLYGKNIFHFYDPGDIRHFSRSVLPQRMNNIQSLLIDWERVFSIFNRDNTRPKFNQEERKIWCEVWAIIGKMAGLITVRVVLKSHTFEVPMERRVLMCRPMMEIMGLKKFELVVPWDDATDWGFADEAPFKIVRGVKPKKIEVP
ncbi:hypothetical protein NA56DRAFT_685803 [Hyaloscypha hepaticicola]|uniref:DUF7730 domain-containing protein n=1 Tax=Hyaloscypha hepaticicola TaxID=2082293 RepID=A0A2J6QIA5_9HELO|nr:hypothetical protein NA56DRAFT_685803 [Hyaloscypha hepaticicola]